MSQNCTDSVLMLGWKLQWLSAAPWRSPRWAYCSVFITHAHSCCLIVWVGCNQVTECPLSLLSSSFCSVCLNLSVELLLSSAATSLINSRDQRCLHVWQITSLMWPLCCWVEPWCKPPMFPFMQVSLKGSLRVFVTWIDGVKLSVIII